MQEYRSGYTLRAFLLRGGSAGGPKSNEPLGEYYPTMLRHLNVKDELARWEQTAKSRPK